MIEKQKINPAEAASKLMPIVQEAFNGAWGSGAHTFHKHQLMSELDVTVSLTAGSFSIEVICDDGDEPDVYFTINVTSVDDEYDIVDIRLALSAFAAIKSAISKWSEKYFINLDEDAGEG